MRAGNHQLEITLKYGFRVFYEIYGDIYDTYGHIYDDANDDSNNCDCVQSDNNLNRLYKPNEDDIATN